MNAPHTPLQADGLSRRVYPFLGLAIVGLVSLHGYSAVLDSPVLTGAAVVGILLILIPLVQLDIHWTNRFVTSVPVMVGFGMAPMDAIHSATSRAAEMLDMKGEIGVLGAFKFRSRG